MKNRAFLKWYGSQKSCILCSSTVGLMAAAVMQLAFVGLSCWYIRLDKNSFVLPHLKYHSETEVLNSVLLNVLFVVHLARVFVCTVGALAALLGVALKMTKLMLIFWVGTLVDLVMAVLFSILYTITFQWSPKAISLMWFVCAVIVLFDLWVSSFFY